KSSDRTVVVSVAVTAAVILVVALFLCVFGLKCPVFSSRRHGNDERPLLTLSLGDYSTASSRKLIGRSSQAVEEKADDDQPFPMKLSFVRSKVSDASSIGNDADATGSTETFSGMPPGMWDAPVYPPLKPPPGRAELRKPPSAHRASSSDLFRPGNLPAVKSQLPPPPPPPSAVVPPPGRAELRKPPSARRASSSELFLPGNLPAVQPQPLPPPPPPSAVAPPPPLPSRPRRPEASPSTGEGETVASSKAKLKPFFWDKVMANPDHSMVWDQIKSGSFQFDEEIIQNLFGFTSAEKTKNDAKKKESPSQDASPQHIKILDPKKAQNLSILLRALNVTTEEVRHALIEGNELPPELIQSLVRMAPTPQEESKLRLYTGELAHLGPAERFLKAVVDIPFAFKRLESLLFIGTLQEELSMLNHSFAVLEAACSELRKSRLFLKLLEAVLKTGNRMNDGTFRGHAHAFKLDTLLKLSDVKGTDGKTTLLHFVVEEIVRSESSRAAREAGGGGGGGSSGDEADSYEHFRSIGIRAVSGIGDELRDVKEAAVLDVDALTGTVAKLGNEVSKARKFLDSDMKSVAEDDGGFLRVLEGFVESAEADVASAGEEGSRILELVKNTSAYFHGNSGKDEGLRLFVVVRDFLVILDKVCKQVKQEEHHRKRPLSTTEGRRKPSPDIQQLIFPAIVGQRVYDSSSEDES
ncbi:hypothetical protein M569_05828, partial [Genlisea aurea]